MSSFSSRNYKWKEFIIINLSGKGSCVNGIKFGAVVVRYIEQCTVRNVNCIYAWENSVKVKYTRNSFVYFIYFRYSYHSLTIWQGSVNTSTWTFIHSKVGRAFTNCIAVFC